MGEEEAAAMGERLSGPLPVLKLLQKHDGLVVLGDPGSGKSTFLKHLALALLAGKGKELGLGKDRLPVLVPLAAYASAAKAKTLGCFLARYYQERDLDLPLDTLLAEALRAGRVLLLFDGLDEVRDPRTRVSVIGRVRDFYTAHRAAGNKFVLTSRIVGYREVRLPAEGLAECTLVDFEDEEIAAFVERWTRALEKAASGETAVADFDARKQREDLLEAIGRNASVRSLAANPLLLTILAVMKRQGVSLPERRAELYHQYVKTLLSQWNLARSLTGQPLESLDVDETLKVLAPLALWMHETSPGVGLVPEAALGRKLEELFQGDRSASKQFLQDIREHAALLLDRGGRQYGFIHLTFQEYLAAVALGQKGQLSVEPVVAELLRHVGEDTWSEVSQLAVGYLGVVQQRPEAAGAVLEKLIAADRSGEAIVLAGTALADIGKAGIPPGCQEQVVAALVRTMKTEKGVQAPTRARAGRVLAVLGDPRPEVMTVDGMELCQVPAGPFRMGEGAEELEVVLAEFRIGRYPVTVAQFREFVEESGFEPGDEDCLKGAANEPVVYVSWREALAFCGWLTERWRGLGRLEEGREISLPSEAEWEKAARGPEEARAWPWRAPFDPEKANSVESGVGRVSAVGCFPGGKSFYGVEDLSGNVWEWTRSEWAEGSALRVLRGGSYFDDDAALRCAARHWFNPVYRLDNDGFRVVVRPFSSEPPGDEVPGLRSDAG